MPKHEGSADVLVLKEIVFDLQTRLDTLCFQNILDERVHRFLCLDAPRIILDLEQHPLGDKRQYITRLLNEAARCENTILESEKYVTD